MWWVSSCVRRERENCCDDLVVAILQNRAEYARTLFALEQRRSHWTPTLAASDGRLLERIRRLVGSPVHTSLGSHWGKGLAGFVVLLLVSIPLAATVLMLASQREAVADVTTEKGSESARTEKTTEPKSDASPAVRVVVGADKKLTFEGEEMNWDAVEAKLQTVPDRDKTILEVAIATDDVSVREMNNAIGTASHYGRQFGYKYTSYIGVHPLGSKGTRPQTAAPTDKSKELSKKVGSNSTNNCILKFPGGGSLEFVGVAPHPADGKTWWAPNGMPLEKPPWPINAIESHVSDRLPRQFGFLFHNPPANIDLNGWSFHSEGSMSGTLVIGFDANDKQVKNALGISTSYDKDAKEATISVGVAARPRRFVLSVDSSGKVITGSKDWLNATKVLVAEHKEPAGFGHDLTGNAETFFGFDRPDFYDFDDRVVAIDADGKEHFPFGFPLYHDDHTTSDAIKPFNRLHQGSGFDIPLSRVKEFRILARSYKTDYNWFTFENVSLQPGHLTQPKARIDRFVDEGPKSQHLAFKPRPGMANETSWTELVALHIVGDKSSERLMANVALDGEFPVIRHGDKQPLFKVKLTSCNDESLNIKLTGPDGLPYDRVLHRGKPLSWKLKGKSYQLLYPETAVALDQPAERPFATIIITSQTEEAAGAAKSPDDKPVADSSAHSGTEAPGE
jgi:hypothetical protein